MSIRTIIVDDEPLALEELAFQLGSFKDVEIVAQAVNGIEAEQLIRQHQPDLVFLDIQMPGKDGFQVARDVSNGDQVPHIVFVTAYDQYALKAFDVNAIDYLLKPIEESMIDRAIQRVRKQQTSPDGDMRGQIETLLRTLDASTIPSRKPGRIAIKKEARIILVDMEDIVYAYIADGVVFVVTAALEGMTSYRTLEELEADLDDQVFWRVHRGYIANINRVSEVVPWFSGTYRLVMDGAENQEIPLSRAQSKKLRKVLKW